MNAASLGFGAIKVVDDDKITGNKRTAPEIGIVRANTTQSFELFRGNNQSK